MVFIFLIKLIAGSAENAQAYPNGVSGFSGNPATGEKSCLLCHGGGQTPNVTIIGPAIVSAKSVNEYLLRIEGSGNYLGGLDVSTTAGMLDSLDSSTLLKNGEITHAAPKSARNGVVEFAFKLTAPTSGNVDLYAAGLSSTDGTDGSAQALSKMTIAVQPINQMPVAKPGGPYKGEQGMPLSMDGSASEDPDGEVVSYRWDFGDGQTGEGAKVVHSYKAAGTYAVSLTVTDDKGGITTASTTATVTPLYPPVSVPGGPYKGMIGEVLGFDGNQSTDPDGWITSFSWDFGDGTTASGARVAHTYKDAGTFAVKLTVIDNRGLVGTATTTATITEIPNRPPHADAGGPCVSKSKKVRLNGFRSYDPDGQISKYLWDFGDGSKGEGEQVRHKFPRYGKTYKVTLTVMDNKGATGKTETTVEIKHWWERSEQE